MRRRGYGIGGKDSETYSETMSRRYTHRDVLRVKGIFITPEYGSASRKDAITSFSKNNDIGLNFEELNPFISGLDHVRSLKAREEGEVIEFNYKKRE